MPIERADKRVLSCPIDGAHTADMAVVVTTTEKPNRGARGIECKPTTFTALSPRSAVQNQVFEFGSVNDELREPSSSTT